MEIYGNICASNLKDFRQSLSETIKVDCPIDVYFQQVEDTIQIAQDGKKPFAQEQIVQTAYHSVNKTGLCSLTLKEWHKKAAADNTWASFKQVFAEEYHELVE